MVVKLFVKLRQPFILVKVIDIQMFSFAEMRSCTRAFCRLFKIAVFFPILRNRVYER